MDAGKDGRVAPREGLHEDDARAGPHALLPEDMRRYWSLRSRTYTRAKPRIEPSLSQQGSMTIFVKTLTGNTYTLRAYPSDTIETLKQKIADLSPYLPGTNILSFLFFF